MEKRRPLTELRPSQVQRRPPQRNQQRVYGKKRNILANRMAFYLPDSDQSDGSVNTGMGNLKIEELKVSTPTAPESAPESKNKKKSVASSPRRLSHDGSAPATKPSALLPADLREFAESLCAESNEYPKLHNFQKWVAKALDKGFNFEKIAEGSYSDCYLMTGRNDEGEEIDKILKIIPVLPQRAKPEPGWTNMAEVVREVKLTKTLSHYPGFVSFSDLLVAVGLFPDILIESFRDYHKIMGRSNYPDPANRFKEDQVYAVLELGNAGEDMELLKKPSAFQVFDVFWMTVICFAKGEKECQFEHRDFHVSNCCYQSRNPEYPIGPSVSLLSNMENPDVVRAGLSNILPTAIDYTHSRATLNNTPIYNTQENWSLFAEVGRGAEEKMQFATMKRMQRCIYEADRQFRANNPTITEDVVSKYSLFVPKTNVCWLVYLLRALYNRGRKEIMPGSNDTAEAIQQVTWVELKEIIEEFKDCAISELPEGAEALLDLGLEKGWITGEEVSVFVEALSVA